MGRAQRCIVRFSNAHGLEHSTEVEASSLFEAACRGWAKFKSSDETFDESYRTEEFIIEVHEVRKTYKVNLENLLRWLDEIALFSSTANASADDPFSAQVKDHSTGRAITGHRIN
jgi:hypothetical protein